MIFLVVFGINTAHDISKLSQISKLHEQYQNITHGIYAKYQYKSCYYLY